MNHPMILPVFIISIVVATMIGIFLGIKKRNIKDFNSTTIILLVSIVTMWIAMAVIILNFNNGYILFLIITEILTGMCFMLGSFYITAGFRGGIIMEEKK